ncbi:trafficking protein particle complex subunit 3-like [Paramacrobiotus metropolitanus]|uniref:trafficking protein particle complex subunit 3-like n=1 Tax=Paramacrobiotus metropolitanus TaxID=2943436 RepID=UPI00244636ED|nr:trafficking protein particle complex subunit 3-like [Paramacrobiotus metropolitanus]
MAAKGKAALFDNNKVNADLIKLTYGALVAQIIKDYERPEEVNKQLDKLGYNIGVRLIEDFLAHHNIPRCLDFRQTAERVQQAFRFYMGVQPFVGNWSPSANEFSLIWEQTSPIGDFVEFPDSCRNLEYSRVLCGAVRGALEMVQIDVKVSIVREFLLGESATELKVHFTKRLEDALPVGED